MRVYLNSNIGDFDPLAKSKRFKLTHYVDGLTDTIFDQMEERQNPLQGRLGADEESLVEEAQKLIKYVHSATQCKWQGYHCFIGIQNNHTVLYFIPIESRETPYNSSGWHEYNSSFEVDILRIQLDYSEEDWTRYAVYIKTLRRQVENVRVFLWCNIFTSPEALETLAYTTALQFGNHRELESDCLEFAKAAAKSAKQYFATETELAKAKTKLEVKVVGDIDNLTVTIFKSKALSRHNLASRFSVLISMPWMQHFKMAYVSVLVMMVYHFFIRKTM